MAEQWIEVTGRVNDLKMLVNTWDIVTVAQSKGREGCEITLRPMPELNLCVQEGFEAVSSELWKREGV